MANLRGASTKNVDLTVAAYDKSKAYNKESGELTAQYVTAGLHPDSELAQRSGQTLLALNSKKDDKSPSGYDNSHAYLASDDPEKESQMDLIAKAAGDNKTPLLTKNGEEVGTIYVVKADLVPARDKTGYAINTKTLAPSELTAGPDANGRDLQTRIFETQKANKAAKVEKDAAAKEAPEAEAEAQTEAQTEAQNELGG